MCGEQHAPQSAPTGSACEVEEVSSESLFMSLIWSVLTSPLWRPACSASCVVHGCMLWLSHVCPHTSAGPPSPALPTAPQTRTLSAYPIWLVSCTEILQLWLHRIQLPNVQLFGVHRTNVWVPHCVWVRPSNVCICVLGWGGNSLPPTLMVL